MRRDDRDTGRRPSRLVEHHVDAIVDAGIPRRPSV
jgi:hypothetical protein